MNKDTDSEKSVFWQRPMAAKMQTRLGIYSMDIVEQELKVKSDSNLNRLGYLVTV